MIPELTQTILAGILPLTAVGMLLVRLRHRYPAVRLIALPALIAAFAAGHGAALWLGTGNLEQQELLLRVSLALLIVVILVRVLSYYLFTSVLERERQLRVPPLLPRVLAGFLYIVAALIVVSMAFPAARVGPLLATSAVTSLVLGLALQPILTNFFAGVVIALERPFRINDWIQIGEDEGRVTAITWRTTYIRTRENDNVIFPNALVAQEKLINFLYPHRLHMARIYVGVHYRTPPHRVRAAIEAAASRVDGILDRPSIDVYVRSFDDSAVTYELRAWIDDMVQLRRIESDARQQIWEEFHRRGIVIPFPIRTLEIARPRRSSRAEGEAPLVRLFVIEAGGSGAQLDWRGGRIIVGRDAGCDLVIQVPAASKEHFAIAWEDGRYMLSDLGSTHGTTVDDAAVDTVELADLARIRVADTTIMFEVDDD